MGSNKCNTALKYCILKKNLQQLNQHIPPTPKKFKEELNLKNSDIYAYTLSEYRGCSYKVSDQDMTCFSMPVLINKRLMVQIAHSISSSDKPFIIPTLWFQTRLYHSQLTIKKFNICLSYFIFVK